MKLSENLEFRVNQYLQSREFLWDRDSINEFRQFYRENIGGEFGNSPDCWRKAINLVKQRI